MVEKILNGYVKIEPLTHKSFVPSEHEMYQEIGKVVAKDDKLTDIPIGAKVYFDSFMAKKYPIEGDDEKFQWFIQFSEIVKVEYENAPE